jgi:hypothetical protein
MSNERLWRALGRPDPEAPTDLRDLLHAEHMLIWTLRAIAVGQGDCPLLRREFVGLCGPVADETFGALHLFVRLLGFRGARPLVLAPPGCPSISRDEQQFLSVFAAAADAVETGRDARLMAALRWLLARPPEAPFADVAMVVARGVMVGGGRLRLGAEATQPSQKPRVELRSLRLVG